MSKRKFGLALSMVLAAGTLLGACGTDKAKEKEGSASAPKEDTFSIAMVTDTGGVDDKSFNQSAWTGIKEYGEENKYTKGDGGYDYLQSAEDADYLPNFNKLVQRDFDLIFGVGFLLKESVEEIATQRPDNHFALVDETSELPNVASLMFKEQEGAFLAGVAAAKMTKSDKIGFVGGMDIPVIERFEAGFLAGVAAVKPELKVDVQYTGDFAKAELGKAAANRMYSSGVDIIFHAAGGSGNGVFAEAKERKKANPDEYVWVIGVDSDQYEEGKVGDDNITLTSMLKRVDIAVKNTADLAAKGEFPGGEVTTFGLADNGIALADSRGAIPQDVLDEVEKFTKQIADGEIEVPEFRAK
ncbi:BMP family ABC transporter substrate-binding protein [Sporosarcina sp. ANT_H38]|uniref:BMP family lipoprotein n=1 Tax=Sporosarcina sp. ANT_H38 TaxID=2597358 RepID=UPI0011F0A2A3|nr:BMP family protein [Sporosarcina sp. ANT_H38]KAA0966460.1 BMP family ABC transporter substrate-binding protein [Sporosarcina sp. ANT_H38]